MPARTGRAFPSRVIPDLLRIARITGGSFTLIDMDHQRLLNPASWDGTVTAYLEIHGKSSDAASPFVARLFNVTTTSAMAGSDVSIASASNTRGRSGAFSLTAGDNLYKVQYGGATGFTYTPDPYSHAVLILDVA